MSDLCSVSKSEAVLSELPPAYGDIRLPGRAATSQAEVQRPGLSCASNSLDGVTMEVKSSAYDFSLPFPSLRTNLMALDFLSGVMDLLF